MKTTNLKWVAIVLLALITLNSCEYIIDDVYDCVINRHPVLSNDQLKSGNINEFYSDYIFAEIKNYPDDDDFDYHFEISGNLPNDIDWFVENRTVTFKGTPYRSGNFSFTVELRVEGSIYWDESTNEYVDKLCTDYTRKEFSIIIHE